MMHVCMCFVIIRDDNMLCLLSLGAELLNQLARMKQRLQSERRRVETDVSREQVHLFTCL